MTNPADVLKRLGITLPQPAAPLAAYVPVVRSGELLFISGQLPVNSDGMMEGTLGANMLVADGQAAARLAAINVLAQIVSNGGVTLDKVKRVVKLSIFVASTPDFTEHHLVANGASELIAEVLGDAGQHARAAFGVAALPMGAAVEIEAIVDVSG